MEATEAVALTRGVGRMLVLLRVGTELVAFTTAVGRMLLTFCVPVAVTLAARTG